MIERKDLFSSTGGRETHAIITVADNTLPLRRQLDEISRDYDSLRASFPEGVCPVFCRWFLSDAANQASALPSLGNCAVSVVEQPPMSMAKAALWVWAMETGTVSTGTDGMLAMERNGYTHLFEGSRCRPGMDSGDATYDMLSATEKSLRSRGSSLLGNCVRTWFFVQNVDVNYAGVVEGRNRLFVELGLTPSTRFIASTGIGGRHADKSATVQMDSYSVKGLREGQMRQINAPDYLNPTYEYGVAFERATSVDYGDRRHLFISGTASIDRHGDVVWEGDIRRQTLRMWENVEALLGAAGCHWQDVGHMLVYLRDPADYPVVREMFSYRFPSVPSVILLAPVCRPGWLIEMECIAMRPIRCDYPPF